MVKFIDKIKSVFKKKDTKEEIQEEVKDENPYAKYTDEQLIDMKLRLLKDINVYMEMSENRSRDWHTFNSNGNESSMFASTILSQNIDIIHTQINHIEEELIRRKEERLKNQADSSSEETEREPE